MLKKNPFKCNWRELDDAYCTVQLLLRHDAYNCTIISA